MEEFNVKAISKKLYRKQLWLESHLVKLVKRQDKIRYQIETLKSKESPVPSQLSPTPVQCKPGILAYIEKLEQDKTPVRKSSDEVQPKTKRKRQEGGEEGDEVTEASSSSSKLPEPSSPPELSSPAKFLALWDKLDKTPVKKSVEPVQSKSKSKNKSKEKTKHKKKTLEEGEESETSDSSSKYSEGTKSSELFAFCEKFDKNGAIVDAMRLVIKYPNMSFVEKVHKYVHHMRQKTACDRIYKERVSGIYARGRPLISKKSKDKDTSSA